MLRTPYASERIQKFDPTTGIKVIQLTSYPLPSAHFRYYTSSVTPDNQRVVFFCQRFAGRDAPWDIFRCDTDGLNLFQLTEWGDKHSDGGYYGRGPAVMSLDGATVYVIFNDVLHAVDVETGESRDLCSLEKFHPEGTKFGAIYPFRDEKLYVIRRGDPVITLCVDQKTGEVSELDLGGNVMGCFHDEGRIVVQRGTVKWGTTGHRAGAREVKNVGAQLSIWSVDQNGGDEQFISGQIYAHATPLGRKSAFQGCGLPPNRCIWLAENGQEPRKLCEGPYFWHSGASMDGEWIIADTNWPDQGLQLIHVPTGNFRTLCHPGASLDHIEYGHPHPSLSHDGRIAVFRSDRTNISQVYVALITDEFRESVIAGDLNGRDKWMM